MVMYENEYYNYLHFEFPSNWKRYSQVSSKDNQGLYALYTKRSVIFWVVETSK